MYLRFSLILIVYMCVLVLFFFKFCIVFSLLSIKMEYLFYIILKNFEWHLYYLSTLMSFSNV